MAVMPDNDRTIAWLKFLKALCQEGVDIAAYQVVIRDAINAADQWISDNEASFNSALPEVIRTWATKKQKALLLMFVVEKRFGAEIWNEEDV